MKLIYINLFNKNKIFNKNLNTNKWNKMNKITL